jgi:hypothetical protein
MPYSARRMIKAIVIPILLYGVEFLEPLEMMKRKMEMFMNRARRWIINCFYTINTEVLSVEACLMQIELLLKQIRKMTAIRFTTAMADNNIVTAMLLEGFPIRQRYRN